MMKVKVNVSYSKMYDSFTYQDKNCEKGYICGCTKRVLVKLLKKKGSCVVELSSKKSINSIFMRLTDNPGDFADYDTVLGEVRICNEYLIENFKRVPKRLYATVTVKERKVKPKF